MKQITYNAVTHEVTFAEVADLITPLPIDVPPTTEERLNTLETNQTSIIETISEIVGV